MAKIMLSTDVELWRALPEVQALISDAEDETGLACEPEEYNRFIVYYQKHVQAELTDQGHEIVLDANLGNALKADDEAGDQAIQAGLVQTAERLAEKAVEYVEDALDDFENFDDEL